MHERERERERERMVSGHFLQFVTFTSQHTGLQQYKCTLSIKKSMYIPVAGGEGGGGANPPPAVDFFFKL